MTTAFPKTTLFVFLVHGLRLQSNTTKSSILHVLTFLDMSLSINFHNYIKAFQLIYCFFIIGIIVRSRLLGEQQ